jgi:SSS family solute:Na+ symporter
MTSFDWAMVVFWVVGTSAFGVYFRKYVKSTRDYLLAGKRLRWWQIATAQAADAVDATDFVATTGQGFRTGLSQIGYAWWGMGIGSILLSRYITPLLYRTGVYTNAEYLELRFTPSLRIASAVIQVLYRFVAMALVVYAMATVFKVIVGMDLWHAVWAAMVLTLLYVLASGQLGVVMAAIPQVLLMMVTSILIFVSATVEIGGREGFLKHRADFGNALHLAGYCEPGVPGGIYLWGLILTLVTYPIVNQTVAQRILGARSEIDARKGTIASLVPWCIITGASTIVGMLGLVILPELPAAKAEDMFPLYMERYLPQGVLGLGVASLVVASMSTGAGIGTAIAGLMTVDVFKYLRRKKRPDAYYLWLTRLFAFLSIVCGTLFAMLIPRFGGMIPFYVAFTGTFFLPLTVPYVGGALYRRASRGSGMAALVAGIGLGTILFLGNELPQALDRPEWSLPTFLSQAQWRPFWVLGFTAIVFVGWSFIENRVRGAIPDTELASILNCRELGRTAGPDEVEQLVRSQPLRPWDGQANIDYDSVGIPKDLPWYAHPATFEVSIVALLVVLMIWWW